MQQRQINKPIAVNLDKSKKYLKPEEAFYMLNRERNINGTGTLGKTTPLVANYLACLIDMPEGDNYSVGHYFSELTNELYWWVYNTNGVNFIARIIADGSCEIVYDGDCLPLSAAPEHYIADWRCFMKYDRYCAHRHGKQLVWTDGENEIGMLDVEASIATNSFTTDFFNNCPDDCAPVQMCVPEPCGALEGEFIPLPSDETDLNNHLIDIGIKVAFFEIYYDQRETVMSDISTLFYQDSKGCFDAAEGFPRCLKLTVPLGNPLVDKIEIVFSTDNGATWKSSDIIEKYMPYSSNSQYWYERELADLPDLDLDNCTFSYTFCNDKQCNPIDPKRSSRVFNPMPRKPQGMFRIKNSLAFYNYLKGNCPLDGTEVEKFQVSVNCSDDNCVGELVTITARVVVHCLITNRNGFVWRLGGNSGDPDDPTFADRAIFGASFTPEGMGQFFAGHIRNFIPYIEGTNYWGQCKQWKAAPYFSSSTEIGVVSGMEHSEVRDTLFSEISAGTFYYQEMKFKVPKGTKGFVRLASHQSTNGLPSEGQDKSTFVVGTIPNLTSYYGTVDINAIITYAEEELYFDSCSGDVTIDKVLVVEDNYKVFQTGAHTSSAYAGYLTDANNVPIEGAEIYDIFGTNRCRTDHNGFYHFAMYEDGNTQTIVVQVRVETNCVGGFNTVKSVTLDGGYGFMSYLDIQITDADFPGYKTNFYEIVMIPVQDCDNVGVGGIRVALSGSKYQVTDAVTGVATFHVRNYSSRNRSVRGLIMDVNGCFSLDCSNDCNPCLPSTDNTLLSACFSGTPYLAIIPTSDLNKEVALATNNGLKSGGRYPFAIVVKGSCGKISAAYPITALSGSLPTGDNYINIPKTQEKGVLSFCNFDYNATGMVLPNWAECVLICRGTNVNNYELQWVVDKIDRTADGKIKLTIESLNDYNARYNFETNTIYQYQKNDRVEFISNGDGSIFDISTYGLLNYQILSPFHDKIISGQTEAPADFFNQILIDDDGKLDSLTVGAKIELQRPATCTVEPTYFAVASLPVIEISGQVVLQNPTGSFHTFDTYIVNRQIESEVPLEANPIQQFEHKFPSDFWGQENTEGLFTGLSDIGKPYFVNKFENEKREGRGITVNAENKFNYFGDLEKTLDAPEQGDIIAVSIYDGKIGLGIGEFDSFLFQLSDEFLRLGPTGLVQAAPADSLVSDVTPKISGIFGCRYTDIGSVWFGDGFALWIDSGKSALVKHDFSIARDMSQNKFNLWVKKMVQLMEYTNANAPNDISKLRFCNGFNYHTGAMQLTVKALNDSGINNQQAPFLQNNNTILIEPVTEELLTFASYTQEGYSNIKLNTANGAAFVSFLAGVPYVHPIIPIKYNEFNGTACDSIVGVAINQNPDKIKRPSAIEIQDEIRWYVSDVRVDNPSFQSLIPPVRFKKTENKWNAEFLCNINARGGLYGTDSNVAGEKPRGYFCAVTFCRDNTNGLQFNSIDNAKRIIFDELDLILFKYSISEQSGFTENI